jgi:hypothetical protein
MINILDESQRFRSQQRISRNDAVKGLFLSLPAKEMSEIGREVGWY